MIIAGIDIGNASTETALARYVDGKPEFLRVTSSMPPG